MKRMNPSSVTTLRSIPSTLRLLASFMLITGSAQDARTQQIPSQPGSKPQIPFFAEFLHLFFLHHAFGFHGWCGQRQELLPCPITVARPCQCRDRSPLLGGSTHTHTHTHVIVIFIKFIIIYLLCQGSTRLESPREQLLAPAQPFLEAAKSFRQRN